MELFMHFVTNMKNKQQNMVLFIHSMTNIKNKQQQKRKGS